MKNEEKKNENNEENFEDLTFVSSNEDGEPVDDKDHSKKIREDLKICRKEKEEYLTGWQRSKADYINLHKELNEIKQNVSILTKERVIGDLLPVLDSFDMAFSNKEVWEKVDSNWRMGITYIYQQFLKILSEMGVEKINETEVIFDPSLHQSVANVPTDDEDKDHKINEVVQIGFRLNDRVIRPAKVKIYEFKKQ